MPLITGKSPSSFSRNVETEMHAGKPLKQSLAIAYAMKRKAQNEAKGGEMCAHGKYVCHEHHGGQMMADGGFVKEEEATGYLDMPQEHEKMDHAAMMEDDRMLNQHGEHETAAMGMDEDNEPQHEHMIPHALENQDDHEDMVGRIMKQRSQQYSEGGRVANETPIKADFEDNQFDDLVKEDGLEDHYTAKNSGDEIGNAQEDEDREDMVARIMRSRAKRDRLPNPM